jgi:amino acid adenylation domain-containing protein
MEFQPMESVITDTAPGAHADLHTPQVAGRQLSCVGWNETAVVYPKDACIHHLFEAQAVRTPAAVALIFNEERVSYGELNRRANQLAHRLRGLGVGPEVLVGIMTERSVEMVVGLLAILKAGGAYLPLDPAYPRERLQFMLEDAAVKVLLTQGRLAESLSTGAAWAINLDTCRGETAGESVENPDAGVTAENLAYVIYTSGSTGQPKGVEVPHRGVVRLLFGVDYVRLDAGETFLQLAPVSFDASTFEIWGALLHGARCVLHPGCLPTFKELGDAIEKNNVSVLWLTSSLFNAVMDEAPEILAPIGQLLVGGEALSVPHVRRARTLFPTQQLINGYGPTESTTFTCCYPVPRELDAGVHTIPIGRPIANTQVYILDGGMRTVAAGETGELYIGGAGLARGYLNRPELTAERFVANPFSADPGARLYKTGDLVRSLPGGDIEFLGRIDQQVKLRGFRIELGEIEAAFASHPRVRDVAVVAREDVPGDKRLVAYVVTDGVEPAACVEPAHELRQYLKGKLPEYMIPSAIVALERMPLTPNGKLDREALPAPERTAAPAVRQCFVGARNELERAIAKVWQEVIRVERIGVDDNLFDLGAHSLHMVQALQKLKASLGADFSITRMFQYPTVSSLARFLSGESSAGPADGACAEPFAGKIQDRAQKQREALARRKQLARGKSQ